jgi:hypothetical protein
MTKLLLSAYPQKATTPKSCNGSKAYKAFWDKNPRDHRKVPEALHSIAECYLRLKEDREAEVWYKKGLEEAVEEVVPTRFSKKSDPKPIFLKPCKVFNVAISKKADLGTVFLGNSILSDNRQLRMTAWNPRGKSYLLWIGKRSHRRKRNPSKHFRCSPAKSTKSELQIRIVKLESNQCTGWTV